MSAEAETAPVCGRCDAVFWCPWCREWKTGDRHQPSFDEKDPWCPPVCRDCVDDDGLTDACIRQVWRDVRLLWHDQSGDSYTQLKRILYGMQEGYCAGCGEHLKLRHLALDHIIPKSKWPKSLRDSDAWLLVNLQLLCGNCNHIKHAGDMEHLRAQLKDRELLSYPDGPPHYVRERYAPAREYHEALDQFAPEDG